MNSCDLTAVAAATELFGDRRYTPDEPLGFEPAPLLPLESPDDSPDDPEVWPDVPDDPLLDVSIPPELVLPEVPLLD
jgi:hypothetical protein